MNSIVTRRHLILGGGGTNVTYLYNEGDECTSVTGGWSISGYTSNTPASPATKNINNMYLASTDSNSIKMLGTGRPIDLSKYKKLCVEWRGTKVNTDNIGIMVTFTTQKEMFNSYRFLSISNSEVTSQPIVSEKDISDINEIGYAIAISFHPPNMRTGYIYKIWLE